MSAQTKITLAIAGEPATEIQMDAAQASTLRSLIGATINFNGKRLRVTAVPVKLQVTGSAAQLYMRLEGQYV